MKRKGFAVGIILLFIGVSITPISAQKIEKSSSPTSGGNWLYVGGSGPGNYTEIQVAINNALYNDTIFVYNDSSPYYEHLKINTRINLIGENKETTIIDGQGHQYLDVIIVNAPYTTITNFTIRGSGYSGAGIFLKSDHNKVNNNILNENYYGIHFYNVNYAIVTNNLIQNNIIRNNTVGIYVWQTNNAIISKNSISGNSQYGIEIVGSYFNDIIGNNFTDNLYGLELWDVKFTTIRENNFIKNKVLDISDNVNSFLCKWEYNYWGESRIFPKKIPGTFNIYIPFVFPIEFKIIIPNIKIDWHPAKEPYNIGS
jgi:parallel beta-helix repeat protein